MPGVIIFDPNNPNIGLSLGDAQASAVYLDIEDDTLFYTDTVNIYEWDADDTTNLQYTWKSGRIRMPRKTNLGAAMIEADSYDSIIFKLYADGTLKMSAQVFDSEPFRLPGGYLSNLYDIEVIGTDRIRTIVVGQTLFDLASG